MEFRNVIAHNLSTRHMSTSGMSMSGMDSPGLFTKVNERRALIIWYLVVAATAVALVDRVYGWRLSWTRNWRRREGDMHSTRAKQVLERVVAGAITMYRSIVYPQPIWFSGSLAKYFTPLACGRCVLLGLFWLAILVLLWTDVILHPDDELYPYRWEKVGFRAAWISIAQIPLVYLLSCKFNLITVLTGISYERFNWAHRWSARTVFLTVIVHWAYFFTEWWQADFVRYELEIMPMVKYGFGAWVVLGWSIVSSFGYFRAVNHELFIIQHIAAAAILLWLLYVHVPAYTAWFIWLSVAFLVLDWSLRIILGLTRNLHLASGSWRSRPGYLARLEPMADSTTRLTIDKVDFCWRPGQHVYISIPSIRPFELHPFTIASSARAQDGNGSSLTLVIKSYSGFSKSIGEQADKDILTRRKRRIFLSWPLGSPPDLSYYDTIIFLACSTGMSFVSPLLQDIVQQRACVRAVHLHWMIKKQDHVSWYDDALIAAIEGASRGGLALHMHVHVTHSDNRGETELQEMEQTIDIAKEECGSQAPDLDNSSCEMVILSGESMGCVDPGKDSDLLKTMVISHRGRPSIDQLIEPGIETADGETAIVSCGGQAFTAQVRTHVAMLLSRRGARRESGQQGIYLFTETFSM